MPNPLDEVIWNALTTAQRHHAELYGDAVRFAPALTSLAAVREPTQRAFEDLAHLLAGSTAGVFQEHHVPIGAALDVLYCADLVQMIQPAPCAPGDATGLITLGPDDAPEMLDLAERTRPGPFGARTHELGTFLGVREGGKLIAMAGQRMRLEGLIEISGVCTDPAHLGRGLAAKLLAAQCQLIHAAGATPFLHVRADNARAIALYERFGFTTRWRARYHVVRAAGLRT